MGAPLAVAVVVKDGGTVIASLALAGAFFLGSVRARALCVLVALLLSPILLVGELWNTSQVHNLRAHPLELVGLIVVGAGLMAALAAVFLRRPILLPVLAVAALPFRVPVQSGGQTALLLVPLYLVVGGGSLAYVWERLRNPVGPSGDGYRFAPAERNPGYVELALILAIVLYSIQSAYSTDFETAVKNVAFFYIPFALLLKLVTSLDWTDRLLKLCLRVLVGLAVLFVLVGFWEYHARHLLWNPSVIESNQFQSYFRVNSLFFDPNIYGRFLVMVMIALAAILLFSASSRIVLGLAVLLALLWGGLVLSFSQSSIAALLVGLAVLAAVRWRAKPVIALVVAGLIVAGLVVLAAPSSVHLKGHSAKSLNHATSGRFNLMKGGLRMFADRPIYGYGAGSFAERFRARERKSEAQAASASHTIPITVAAEQGIVGLAVYVFLLFVSFRLLFEGLLSLRGPGPPTVRMVARLVMAAAFSALAFHTLLYADFLEDPLTWMILGLGIALRRSAPRARRREAMAAANGPAEPARTGSSSP
jgi:putative inorganic carbon (hco3(-)) transporter